MTQHKQILRLLLRGGWQGGWLSIYNQDIKELGLGHKLSTRVSELRKMGFKITKRMRNPIGEQKKVMEYRIDRSDPDTFKLLQKNRWTTSTNLTN